MCLRGWISDSGEQMTFCGPLEVTFTRYRSHFPSLFHLGQWMCREALREDVKDFHKLFIWRRNKSVMTTLFHILEPLLSLSYMQSDDWTYLERIVNQTSNLFFCLHGTLAFNNTSKRNLVRAGLPVENKQNYFFHLLLEELMFSQTIVLTLTRWLTTAVQWLLQPLLSQREDFLAHWSWKQKNKNKKIVQYFYLYSLLLQRIIYSWAAVLTFGAADRCKSLWCPESFSQCSEWWKM